MALPEASRRGGLPLRVLARQPVESFPWDKLQTVPLPFSFPFASRKRRAFKGTADRKRLNNHGSLREYRVGEFPEIPETVSNSPISFDETKFNIFNLTILPDIPYFPNNFDNPEQQIVIFSFFLKS